MLYSLSPWNDSLIAKGGGNYSSKRWRTLRKWLKSLPPVRPQNDIEWANEMEREDTRPMHNLDLITRNIGQTQTERPQSHWPVILKSGKVVRVRGDWTVLPGWRRLEVTRTTGNPVISDGILSLQNILVNLTRSLWAKGTWDFFVVFLRHVKV